MYSSRNPPTSGVSVSFPSEKAPAPPQPQSVEQSLHGTHDTPLMSAGHCLSSRSLPFSSIRTLRPLTAAESSSAAKIPAGPEPTITMS